MPLIKTLLFTSVFLELSSMSKSSLWNTEIQEEVIKPLGNLEGLTSTGQKGTFQNVKEPLEYIEIHLEYF